jgi:hypothetical protein
MTTHCLDVAVGYHESVREELIAFLKEQKHAGKLPSVKAAERGMWNETKILRIFTPQSHEVMRFILERFRCGDDCSFQTHETELDALRRMAYIADYETKKGFEKFEL